MKKINKILVGLLSVIAIGSVAVVPINANALGYVIGYDSDGNAIIGGIYDELVGFDEDGNPIIVYNPPTDPDAVIITIATDTAPLPEVEDTTEEPEVTTVTEETNKSSVKEVTVGESTYPLGDINLDGNVNTVDLLMLKKYLLGLMEW